MVTRVEVEETDNFTDENQAHSIGIGRCGCGKGCGMVFIGMRNKEGDCINAFQMHWTEIGRFVTDIAEQASEARREEEEAVGRAN